MTVHSPIADPNWVEADVLTDTNEQFTAWLDIHDLENFTVMLNAVMTDTPGDLTVTLEVSQDVASELNADTPSGVVTGDYDKIIDKAGVDSPVASILISGASAYRVFSVSAEDTIRSIRLGYKGAQTINGTHFWTVDAGYSGNPRR